MRADAFRKEATLCVILKTTRGLLYTHYLLSNQVEVSVVGMSLVNGEMVPGATPIAAC